MIMEEKIETSEISENSNNDDKKDKVENVQSRESTYTRPSGPRPSGPRPSGPRPSGSRPSGSRPFGSRPFGSRSSGSRTSGSRTSGRFSGKNYFFKKRFCFFCRNKDVVIDYKNVDLMKKFVAESCKISPRRFTGTCAKHQRKLVLEIKKARQMALLPYIEK
jgi:small subunit ribosomal protein S18